MNKQTWQERRKDPTNRGSISLLKAPAKFYLAIGKKDKETGAHFLSILIHNRFFKERIANGREQIIGEGIFDGHTLRFTQKGDCFELDE